MVNLAKATDIVAPNFTRKETRPANPILDDLTIGNNLIHFQRAISIAQYGTNIRRHKGI